MAFTVAIIGRPNTGKSTLFNRLVGRRLALVDDQPGVTRDLREGAARLGDLGFTALDTAGLEPADEASLSGRMRKLTERAVEMADAAIFLIDARAGVVGEDREVAAVLRRRGARVVLAANKAEGRAAEGGLLEAYELGLGEPVAISGEHGEGMADLQAALRPLIAGSAGAPEAEDDAAPVRIAVVGRPNVGKSTLVNRILGEERLLTGPEAGITRDSIGIAVDWGGTSFRIFDTAGLRKRARVQEKLEKLSTADALRAVRFAEVVILLTEPDGAFETQDLRLADLAEREGRAVVVAVNKWDLAEDRQARLRELKAGFARLLPQLRGAELVAVSALTGRGFDRLRDAALEAREIWGWRISTGRLNRWLRETVEAHPPPAPSGRRIRIRYVTQVKARPPSFVAFCSKPEDLPESYKRYLIGALRDDLGLKGVPIRLSLRKGENPYAGR